MTTKRVRKWKVMSAAWAGVAAGLIAGPLAYALIASSEPSGPPVGVRVVAQAPPSHAARGSERVHLGPVDPAVELDALLRTARSGDDVPVQTRTQAIARIGQVDHPEAVQALVALAQEGRTGADPNFVSLAALNALWARGEKALVGELAEASPDPAVKSKALALARARAR